MDNTEIDAIAALAAKNTKIATDIPAIVIPKNTELTSLEKLMKKPARYRSEFTTSLLDEFVDYCNTQDADGGRIFVDPETMTAQAIFDMGTPEAPGWGSHRARLISKETAAFKDIKRYNSTKMTQQQFIDFSEDWAPYLQFYDDKKDPIAHKQAIGSIRRLSVAHMRKGESEIQNFKASRSAMESVEVTAANEQPPSRLVFRTPLFEGHPNVEITLDIRAVAGENDVRLMYRIIGLDEITRELSEKFKVYLQSRLDNTVMIGNISYQS